MNNRSSILFLILLNFLCFQNISGQIYQTGSFDNSLQQLTDALATKLLKNSDLKMAVWDLSNLDGEVSPIGKYIAEDISINLSEKFHITNRNQLNTILKENKLSSEGFINQATLKQVKKLSDIDIIITGTVTVLSDKIKITLQALDADANIIGATKGEVPMNDDVKELLGINSGSSNKGFNHSLNSDEQINNPKTVNSKCMEKNTGDYCFQNDTRYNLNVGIITTPGNFPDFTCTLQPGQKQCFYDLRVGPARYMISSGNLNVTGPTGIPYGYGGSARDNNVFNVNGQINIEQCKSKTLFVK